MHTVSRQSFENFLTHCGWPVSHETIEKFDIYKTELLKWQKIHNLISNNSIDTLWERHFLDSAQLVSFIPHGTKSMVDLGSGAGFPGVVVSLITNIKTALIESNRKKVAFLEHIKESIHAPIEPLHARIESLKFSETDVVTARALAPLVDVLGYTFSLTGSEGLALFLKGQSWQTEINVARETWVFDCDLKTSITNDKAKIIIVKNLKKRSMR